MYNMNKIIKYTAINPNELISSSYNTSLGNENSLQWAKDNARLSKGRVIAEMTDGTIKEIKSYEQQN